MHEGEALDGARRLMVYGVTGSGKTTAKISEVCARDEWLLDTAYSRWIDVPLANVELIVALLRSLRSPSPPRHRAGRLEPSAPILRPMCRQRNA